MNQQTWNTRTEKYRQILSREPMWEKTAIKTYQKVGKETACFVLAPVLCCYVVWVLEEAVRLEKRRVYFLARDGYQMYIIAKFLCGTLKLPIECRYLYCSRYALRKAEYKIDQERMYEYLCYDGLYVTLQTVFLRAGIKEEKEQEMYAELLGMPLKKQLSYRELQRLKPQLKSCRAFDEQQKKRAERAYDNAIGYFMQEGMIGEESWILADSGWSGSLQQTIHRLLESAGRAKKTEGCYFGLYELPGKVESTDYHTWFFSPETGLSRKIKFNNNVFECICTSPEGMCVGYTKKEDGSYQPRLSTQESPNKELSQMLTGVFSTYAGYLVREYQEKLYEWIVNPKNRKEIDYLEIAEQLLALFMGEPTQQEAELYGGFAFCDDVIGEENVQLAAALEKDEIKQNRLFGQLWRRFWHADREYAAAKETDAFAGKNSAWMEASIALAYPEQERGKSLIAGAHYKKELWHCRNVKRVRYGRKQLFAYKRNKKLQK